MPLSTQVSINNILHLARNYAQIFVRNIICSEKQTVFRERNSTDENCELQRADNVQGQISQLIIQHIVTLPKYGHDALDIRNRYPAVYVASYVGKKSEVRKCRQRDLQGFRLFCYQFVE